MESPDASTRVPGSASRTSSRVRSKPKEFWKADLDQGQRPQPFSHFLHDLHLHLPIKARSGTKTALATSPHNRSAPGSVHTTRKSAPVGGAQEKQATAAPASQPSSPTAGTSTGTKNHLPHAKGQGSNAGQNPAAGPSCTAPKSGRELLKEPPAVLDNGKSSKSKAKSHHAVVDAEQVADKAVGRPGKSAAEVQQTPRAGDVQPKKKARTAAPAPSNVMLAADDTHPKDERPRRTTAQLAAQRIKGGAGAPPPNLYARTDLASDEGPATLRSPPQQPAPAASDALKRGKTATAKLPPQQQQQVNSGAGHATVPHARPQDQGSRRKATAAAGAAAAEVPAGAAVQTEQADDGNRSKRARRAGNEDQHVAEATHAAAATNSRRVAPEVAEPQPQSQLKAQAGESSKGGQSKKRKQPESAEPAPAPALALADTKADEGCGRRASSRVATRGQPAATAAPSAAAPDGSTKQQKRPVSANNTASAQPAASKGKQVQEPPPPPPVPATAAEARTRGTRSAVAAVTAPTATATGKAIQGAMERPATTEGGSQPVGTRRSSRRQAAAEAISPVQAQAQAPTATVPVPAARAAASTEQQQQQDVGSKRRKADARKQARQQSEEEEGGKEEQQQQAHAGGPSIAAAKATSGAAAAEQEGAHTGQDQDQDHEFAAAGLMPPPRTRRSAAAASAAARTVDAPGGGATAAAGAADAAAQRQKQQRQRQMRSPGSPAESVAMSSAPLEQQPLQQQLDAGQFRQAAGLGAGAGGPAGGSVAYMQDDDDMDGFVVARNHVYSHASQMPGTSHAGHVVEQQHLQQHGHGHGHDHVDEQVEEHDGGMHGMMDMDVDGFYNQQGSMRARQLQARRGPAQAAPGAGAGVHSRPMTPAPGWLLEGAASGAGAQWHNAAGQDLRLAQTAITEETYGAVTAAGTGTGLRSSTLYSPADQAQAQQHTGAGPGTGSARHQQGLMPPPASGGRMTMNSHQQGPTPRLGSLRMHSPVQSLGAMRSGMQHHSPAMRGGLPSGSQQHAGAAHGLGPADATTMMMQQSQLSQVGAPQQALEADMAGQDGGKYPRIHAPPPPQQPVMQDAPTAADPAPGAGAPRAGIKAPMIKAPMLKAPLLIQAPKLALKKPAAAAAAGGPQDEAQAQAPQRQPEAESRPVDYASLASALEEGRRAGPRLAHAPLRKYPALHAGAGPSVAGAASEGGGGPQPSASCAGPQGSVVSGGSTAFQHARGSRFFAAFQADAARRKAARAAVEALAGGATVTSADASTRYPHHAGGASGSGGIFGGGQGHDLTGPGAASGRWAGGSVPGGAGSSVPVTGAGAGAGVSSSHGHLPAQMNPSALLMERVMAQAAQPVSVHKMGNGKAYPNDDDEWTAEDVQALHAAYYRVEPLHPNFWQEVARWVPSKTPAQCFNRIFGPGKSPDPRMLVQQAMRRNRAVNDEAEAMSRGRKPTLAAARKYAHDLYTKEQLQRLREMAAAEGEAWSDDDDECDMPLAPDGSSAIDFLEALGQKERAHKFITSFLSRQGGWNKWNRINKGGKGAATGRKGGKQPAAGAPTPPTAGAGAGAGAGLPGAGAAGPSGTAAPGRRQRDPLMAKYIADLLRRTREDMWEDDEEEGQAAFEEYFGADDDEEEGEEDMMKYYAAAQAGAPGMRHGA